jgi:hypothetical protein
MTKMGLDVSPTTLTTGSMTKSKRKPSVKISPIRLVNEIGVQKIWNDLCPKC